MTVPIPTVESFTPVDPELRVALKQRIVAAYLQNPFRDDDTQILSARLGESCRQVTAALQDLCADKLLKPAADRGYMLDALGLAQASGSQVPASNADVLDTADEVSKVEVPATGETLGKVQEVEVVSSATAEVSVAFGHLEEDLFKQLRSDVVEPLRVIQDFLENQEPTQLGLARAALKQICWAVQELGLAGEGPNSAASDHHATGEGFDFTGDDLEPGAGP